MTFIARVGAKASSLSVLFSLVLYKPGTCNIGNPTDNPGTDIAHRTDTTVVIRTVLDILVLIFKITMEMKTRI